MKKVSVAAVAGLLSASLVVPGQAAGIERTQTKTYSMMSGFVVGSAYGSFQTGDNWTVFQARKGEQQVTFSIEDATGRPILGKVSFVNSRRSRDFCGQTDKPLATTSDQAIYVGAFLGTCDDGTPSLVTTGTVTATFSP